VPRVSRFAFPRRPTLLRLNVFAAAVLLAASSYAQTAKVTLDIPAEPLDKALNALARQSGIQILFASEVAKSKNAPLLKGDYTVREALDKLLTGSGLVVREQADKTYTVQPADSSAQLPAVEVNAASEETAYGPVQGYVATRSVTATKTDSSLLETPQSISVITRDRFEAQGAQSVNEALRYSAAVSSYGAGTRSDWYTVVRGFDPSVYLDGLQLPTTINLASWRVDPYQLERIELLRGPSSVLYGQGEPGGTVNMVSKLPTATPLHEIETQIGTDSRRQVAGDFSGKLDEDGKLLYRITGLVRDSNLALGPNKDQRVMLAPSLTWLIDNDTSLTVQATYLRDRTDASDAFLPASGTILPNPNGRISSSLYTGSPDWDHYNKDQYSLGYQFEHRFNDTWSFRQNLRYSKVKLDDHMTYGVGLDSSDSTQSTLLRDAYMANFDYSRLAVDNQLQAKFSTGKIAHTTLIGLDYQRQRKKSVEYDVQLPGSLNLYNPVYPTFDTSVFDGATPDSEVATQEQIGLYLQDQIKFDQHWVLTVSARKDWAKSVVNDLVALTSQTQNDSAYSGRAGLVYLDESGLAPYISYSTSFMPELGRDSSGNMFKPTTGKQLEVGVKYQPANSKLSITGSVFEIKQQNVTTTDLNDPTGNGYVQTGEVRSRGFELEAVAEINRNLNLLASYTYQDVKNTRTNDASTLNKTPIDIPRPHQMASLWLDYTLRAGAWSGLGYGGGVRYVSSNPGATDNSLRIPGYALFDATIHYDWPQWRLSLTGTNLFNREYITGCYYEARCIYGNARQVLATARYRW
jgi:iron complex outermembrane receptor protein